MKKKPKKKFEWTDSHTINHPKSRMEFRYFMKSDDEKRLFAVYEVILEKVSEEIL